MHNYKYHAEIQYETKEAFSYVCAVGNSIENLLKDIKSVMNDYKHRSPEVVQVLLDANGECADVTMKITSILKQKRKRS